MPPRARSSCGDKCFRVFPPHTTQQSKKTRSFVCRSAWHRIFPRHDLSGDPPPFWVMRVRAVSEKTIRDLAESMNRGCTSFSVKNVN